MVYEDKPQSTETMCEAGRKTPATQGQAPGLRGPNGKELCVHEWFERQAALTPDAPAVRSESGSLTYRELNERANQLAHFLRREGVGPNVLVGLSMERCCEVVVGIFGILKAGGAYVPLDPAYPQERLSFMLQDSRALLLLTQQKVAEKFAGLGTKVLCLDSQWAAIAHEPRANSATVAAPENLIYVIYTSGSTGRPKGAGVYHRGFTNLMRWFVTEFAIKATERVLLVSSLSFDLTQKNLYAPLLGGGQLHLLPSGPFDPARIQQLIERHQITLLNCTPSAFYPLIEPAGAGTWQKVSSLRCVVLGGEPISIPRLRPWLQNEACHAEIANTYGPTECTDIAAFYRMNRTNMDRFAFVPLGRPIPNVQVAIVDERLAKCPEGIAGELCIGGCGVGAGYLNAPALTAAKFIANPFADLSSERLYKTGDLARCLPDGNLEFLGRMDHQVKIRGFRIELQEIENVLASHPAVREAVVVVRQNQAREASNPSGSTAAEPRLAAYYVLKDQTTAPPSELRRFLKEKLPEYMVPAAFVCLEHFPLSPNGKVDRRALPEPEQVETPAEESSPSPTDPVANRIAEIWREVLHRPQVGVEDNFFELGGDSLLVAQMISRVREAFQAELPIASVFERPTIAALANLLASGAQGPAPDSAPPPLKPVARNGSAPLSAAQRQFWFLEYLEPGHPASHIPAAIRLEGTLHLNPLRRSLEEIARRHEVLRSTFPLSNGEPVQVVSPEAQVDLEQVDLRKHPAAEREKQAQQLLQQHVRRPFDLAKGPVVRWLLVRLSEQEHILAVAMHHIVSDGWTLGVLFRELDLLYGAWSTQTAPPPLPALPVQCADYACWQLNWLRGAVLERQVAYWKEKLTGAPITVELPCDHAGQTDPRTGALESLVLPKALVERMQAFCRREGVTPFMLWLASLAHALHQWTGQADLVVGTVVAGRNQREIENLVGCFVNFLPLRVQRREQQTTREFLAQIKRTVLEAQAHQECPFDKIVEAIKPKRRLGQAPLYNVAFLLQNYPSMLADCRSLKGRVVPVPVPAPQLDLRFVAEEIESNTTLLCEYRTGLFKSSTIQQLLARLQSTLAMFVQEAATDPAVLAQAPALGASTQPPRLSASSHNPHTSAETNGVQTLEHEGSGQVLTRAKAPGANALLVPIQPRGHKPPLFLVHDAGGEGLRDYGTLGAHLPPDQPLYAIQSRAQIGLAEYSRLEEMAGGYLEVVREIQPQGPYYLGGYCFGGNVAYEMARQFHRTGQEVALLAVLNASPAPASSESSAGGQPRSVFRFARNLYARLKELSAFSAKQPCGLLACAPPRPGQQPGRASVERHNVSVPSPISEKELASRRLHLQALQEHIHQPYPGKLMLLRTRAQGLSCSVAKDFGWAKLARGGVVVRVAPGLQEKFFAVPNVAWLGRELAALLEEAQSQTHTPKP